MTAAADYRALETLRDGQKVEIRALRPSDREGWLAAFRRASAETLHHRLFAVMRVPTEAEADYFLNIDFVKHVALVAMTHENGVPTIIGVCRYVVVQPGQAEIAFVVADDFQRKGLGAALMRRLAQIARNAGVEEFVADVMAENAPMLKVFDRSGLEMTTTTEYPIVRVVLRFPSPKMNAGVAPGNH